MNIKRALRRALLASVAIGACLTASCRGGSGQPAGAGAAGGGAPAGTGGAGARGTGGMSGAGRTGGTSGTDGPAGGAGGTDSGAEAGGTDGGGGDAAIVDAGAGGGATGGAGGTVSSRVFAPAYNGLRGESFNSGWRFNRSDVAGAQSEGFNDSAWRSLSLPHDWSIELPFNANSPAGSNGGFLDGGIGWYRKTFTLDQVSSSQRILVAFDGVYMNSEVWINGTSLGTRPYGYSSFEYDLTPYVRFGGNNVIAVRVNNNQPNSRWYAGSGIYRNVWLTKLSPVHVPQSGVVVSTPAVTAASATVSVVTAVQNQSTASASVTVATTISGPGGALVASDNGLATAIAAGATTTITQSLTVASPQLWSTASPTLYQVRVEIRTGGTTVDTYVTTLGIRTVTFNPATGFALNGENVKLRGVCMHHDLGALGAAVSTRAIERQVEILKAMGANAIRTAHNPPAPELLDVCDRLGVLVMDEAFDTWTSPKTANDYSLYFAQWAQRDLQDMVRRDRNHPSVIIWSIGNEIYSPTMTQAMNLKSWVLAEDGTRPVTWASNQMTNPVHRMIAPLLDLQGYNYAGYVGDYDADHAANPTWNIFGSEVSAAVRSRGIYHTPAGTLTSTNDGTSADRQSSSYDNETARFGNTAEGSYTYDVSRPFVAGEFIWAGFDYIGEPTPYSSYPSKSSYYGIVDTAGFPKDVYYFYKSRWTSAPMVHILPHWNWSAGSNVTVFVYGNCDSVELFLNDISQGSKTPSASPLHLEWNLAWAPGTVRAECRRGGAVVARDEVKTAASAVRVVLSADRSAIAADGRDLVFVTGDIQDANGVFVPTAENPVAFTVSGPGQLVGVDNGNPVDTSSYKGTSRRAFSGKVLAIVRSTGSPGSIVVNGSSSGLTAGSVTVTAL
jgi:beta-galactosidase